MKKLLLMMLLVGCAHAPVGPAVVTKQEPKLQRPMKPEDVYACRLDPKNQDEIQCIPIEIFLRAMVEDPAPGDTSKM